MKKMNTARGRPKLPKRLKKRHRVKVSFNDPELVLAHEKARAAGKTIPEWLRELALTA